MDIVTDAQRPKRMLTDEVKNSKREVDRARVNLWLAGWLLVIGESLEE